MTNKTQDELIIENAPDDCEYIESAIAEDGETVLTRSIKDIRELVELRKENAELERRLKLNEQYLISQTARRGLICQIICNLIENEEISGSDWDYIGDDEYEDIKHLLNVRDLEQQAKGVESIDLPEFMATAFRHINMPDFYPSDIKDAFDLIAHEVREQANKLKGQE